MINKKAAKAIAAPDIISYAGISFFISCENPDLKEFNPSYLAYKIPVIAVRNINKIVLKAPICDPILMNR